MITLFLMALSTANLSAATLTSIDATTPTAQQKPTKPKLVCRTQERLGTRLGGKRVCNTKERWSEIESESGAAVRDAQRNMSSMPTNGT